MESSGDRTRESMEGIKDQWVRSRGGAKFFCEGSVYYVNKESIREEGDSLIVHV